jgi:hypothetical protein
MCGKTKAVASAYTAPAECARRLKDSIPKWSQTVKTSLGQLIVERRHEPCEPHTDADKHRRSFGIPDFREADRTTTDDVANLLIEALCAQKAKDCILHAISAFGLRSLVGSPSVTCVADRLASRVFQLKVFRKIWVRPVALETHLAWGWFRRESSQARGFADAGSGGSRASSEWYIRHCSLDTRSGAVD